MASDEMKARVEQNRRDGYAVFSVEKGPVRLAHLITMVQDIFPNHSLEQLAITEVDSDDDTFVVAAELSVTTRSN